jgi:hypothetical protein
VFAWPTRLPSKRHFSWLRRQQNADALIENNSQIQTDNNCINKTVRGEAGMEAARNRWRRMTTPAYDERRMQPQSTGTDIIAASIRFAQPPIICRNS